MMTWHKISAKPWSEQIMTLKVINGSVHYVTISVSRRFPSKPTMMEINMFWSETLCIHFLWWQIFQSKLISLTVELLPLRQCSMTMEFSYSGSYPYCYELFGSKSLPEHMTHYCLWGQTKENTSKSKWLQESYYLNQCLIIVNGTLANMFHWNFDQTSTTFIEKITLKMLS